MADISKMKLPNNTVYNLKDSRVAVPVPADAVFTDHIFSGLAEDVNYDNSDSGLTSTTVQDALDEIADGGSTGCVELTQAQYDALSEEEKMDDVIYLITDSPDNYLVDVFGDFASIEYSSTASKAYAVGDYIVYLNRFYVVITDISQGDTITPGTNVIQTTVAEQLKKRAETYDWYKSNPDLNVALVSNVRSGNKSQAALQAHDGSNGWRCLMGYGGNLDIWKTTDSGNTWVSERSVIPKSVLVYNADVTISTATKLTFSLPSDFHESLGVVIRRCWPLETWENGAVVTISEDGTLHSRTGHVYLTSTRAQRYSLHLQLVYI